MIAAGLAAALFAPSSPAKSILVRPAAPLVVRRQEQVTFEQYQKLIRRKVSQMSELSWAWTQRRKLMAGTDNPEHKRIWSEVYFAGGGLRSLLHWIDGQLQTRSYREVWDVAPPRLSSLILPGADKDLLTNMSKVNFKNGYGDADGWDVLHKEFWDASLEVGGSTIEKVGVNPDEIRDKYSAIKAYYEGRLTFHAAPESDFAKYRTTGSTLNQNSRIALILRHLRFLVLYSDGAVSQQDVDQMRAIVRAEVRHIKTHNYWIAKSLRKLDQEARRAGKSVDDILAILRETELFVPLAKNGFLLNDKTPLCMFANDGEGVGICKAVGIGKNEKNEVSFATEVIARAMPLARSPDVVIALLTPEVSSPTDAYKSTLDDLWQKHARFFCGLNPTIAQINRAKNTATHVQGSMRIFRECKNIPKTPREFVQFMESGVKNPTDAYVQEIKNFWFANLDAFQKLDPSIKDIHQLKDVVGRVDTIIKLMTWAIPKVKTVEDALLLVHPGVNNPTDAYTAALNDFWTKLVERAQWDLSAEQYGSLISKIPNSTARAKLAARLSQVNIDAIEKKLRGAKTPGAILAAFSLPREIKAESRDRRDALWRERVVTFCKLKPSADEIAEAKKSIDDLESQVNLRQQCVRNARSAAEFIAIMSRGAEFTPEPMARAIAAEWMNQVDAFVKLKPTVDEAKSAISSASSKASIALIRAMIPLVRSLDDAIILTTPRMANPSEAYLKKLFLLWVDAAAGAPEFSYRNEALAKFMKIVKDEPAKVAVLTRLSAGLDADDLLTFLATLDPVAELDHAVIASTLGRWAAGFCAGTNDVHRIGKASAKVAKAGVQIADGCVEKAKSIAQLEWIFGFLRADRSEVNLKAATEIIEKHIDFVLGLVREKSDVAILERLSVPLNPRLVHLGIERFHRQMDLVELNGAITQLARHTADEPGPRADELLATFKLYVAREADPRASLLLASQFPATVRATAYDYLLERADDLASGLDLIPTILKDGAASPERAGAIGRALRLATDERHFVTLFESMKLWSAADRTAVIGEFYREASAPTLDAVQSKVLREELSEDVFFDYLLVQLSKADAPTLAELIPAIDYGPLRFRIRLAALLKNTRDAVQANARATQPGTTGPRMPSSAWWLRLLSWASQHQGHLKRDKINCESLLVSQSMTTNSGTK